jgi:NAD(P)-dependent dehydrogenase (short-subunit alcohol dehydrogenase family)
MADILSGPRAAPTDNNIIDLSGRTALVTGASLGLGMAMVIRFAEDGDFIASADLTPGPLKAPIYADEMKVSGRSITTPTAELINKTHPSSSSSLPRAIFVQCDATKTSSVEHAVEATVKQCGRLDILVNNAGTSAFIHSASFQSGRQCKLHEVEDGVLLQVT